MGHQAEELRLNRPFNRENNSHSSEVNEIRSRLFENAGTGNAFYDRWSGSQTLVQLILDLQPTSSLSSLRF